jgi:NitT/TauT family transport system substrate-binding protein
VRWLSYKDVVPWYQETYLASSEGFLRDRPDAAKRVLIAYLRAVRHISEAKGQWTPDLIGIAMKWTGMPEDLLRKIGGLPHWSQNAAIRNDSLARVQQFWADTGLVKKPVPVDKLVDVAALRQARQTLGVE